MTIFFVSIIIVKVGETEIGKEKFYAARKPVIISDVNIDDIVISK